MTVNHVVGILMSKIYQETWHQMNRTCYRKIWLEIGDKVYNVVVVQVSLSAIEQTNEIKNDDI